MKRRIVSAVAVFLTLLFSISTTVLAGGTTSGKPMNANKQYLDFKQTDVPSDEMPSDVGYIIVGESHVSMAEKAALLLHNAIQETDNAGNLVLGTNIFHIHTLHQESLQQALHYNTNPPAYENLTDKFVQNNCAWTEWLITDNHKFGDDVVEKSALHRIQDIQVAHSNLKKWVVVIMQGFAASTGDYKSNVKNLTQFADSLPNASVYMLGCPIPDSPGNPNARVQVMQYNQYLSENLTNIGFYDWTGEWLKWGYEPDGTQNHIPLDKYYQVYKEHLGKELRYVGPISQSTKREEQDSESVSQLSDYNFQTDNVDIKVPGLSRSYKIAYVSDLHIVANSQDLDDIKYGHFSMSPSDYINFRYNYAKTADGVHSADLLGSIVKYLNNGNFDAVVFGGDMLDHYSRKNVETLQTGLAQINSSIPWMFIYGSNNDHDGWQGLIGGSGGIGSLGSIGVGNDVIDLGEIRIVGINDSANPGISNGILSSVRGSIQSAGKPVILATHVPFDSKSQSVKGLVEANHQGKAYLWTNGSYKWELSSNSSMKSFVNDCIYSDSTNVVEVLAGHVHELSTENKLSNKVSQHIFKASFYGTIGVVNVHP